MKLSVMFRTAMWAGIGAMVAAGWGLYFATADKAIPIGPVVYTLTRLTCPVVAIGLYFSPSFNFGLNSVIATNAVTYALAGLIVETIRQHYQPLNTSN